MQPFSTDASVSATQTERRDGDFEARPPSLCGAQPRAPATAGTTCTHTCGTWRPPAPSVCATMLRTASVRTTDLLGLFADPPRRRDPECFHLSVQVAALDAEHFGGARHVALLLGERAQNELALELIARLVQRAPLAGWFDDRGPGQGGRIE